MFEHDEGRRVAGAAVGEVEGLILREEETEKAGVGARSWRPGKLGRSVLRPYTWRDSVWVVG
jgi:hypothetical protein